MKVEVMFRKDAGSIPSRKALVLGVAFFATGPGLGLIMYIHTTLEFPKHNFALLLSSRSAKMKRRRCKETKIGNNGDFNS